MPRQDSINPFSGAGMDRGEQAEPPPKVVIMKRGVGADYEVYCDVNMGDGYKYLDAVKAEEDGGVNMKNVVSVVKDFYIRNDNSLPS